MPKSEAGASAEARVRMLYPEGGPGRHLKERLKGGDVLIGGMVSEYARPSLTKLYQMAGFDFLFIEYEHTFFGPSDLADAVLAARDNGLPVISKVPELERAEVAKLLECGVVGIQLPRTETRDQLETLRSYMNARPSLTKLYQMAGFDFLFIEYEHTFFGDLADAVLAARDNGLPVISKVPELERGSREASGMRRCRHTAAENGDEGPAGDPQKLYEVHTQWDQGVGVRLREQRLHQAGKQGPMDEGPERGDDRGSPHRDAARL